MKKLLIIALAVLLPATAIAGFIDFETGTDGQTIYRDYPGVEFSPKSGNHWLYADWTSGDYDGPYPAGAYFSEGDFFAWMSVPQGVGDISFTTRTATYVTLGYNAQYSLIVEAYDGSMNLLDTQTGSANLCDGVLDEITVTGTGIAMVRIKEGSNHGNYWLIDDLGSDGIPYCTLDVHCDDGIYCNGAEACVVNECVAGTEPCADDGLYCNGTESCDEANDLCDHTGDPCADDGLFCNGDESCNETDDQCDHTGDPCADDGAFCNGNESCNETSDVCESSGDPCADDSLFCNGGESCDETNDECDHDGDPCVDDDLFCNGAESCDETNDECDHSGDPCPDDDLYCNGTQFCDEEADACSTTDEPCPDDGLFCNGAESCDENDESCTHTGDPCPPDEECSEDTESCGSTGPGPVDDDDDDNDDTDDGDEYWPEGDVSGGASDSCCSC
jgi:hypothetical protein